MHLLYCDETNMHEKKGDFLVYGGLFAEASKLHSWSLAMDALRADYGVPRDFHLKFNPGPQGMAHSEFVALKKDVIALAAEHQVKLLVYVILHDVASSPDLARRKGINAVSYQFHRVLNLIGGPGIVLIDRFNDEGNKIEDHLRQKFSVGLTGLPHAAELRLPNILGFHYSAIGQSHMPSLVDIVLGSFRFAINAHTRREDGKMPSSKDILLGLSPLFWRRENEMVVPEIGLQFSPKSISFLPYHERYVSLKNFLSDCGIDTEQQIINKWFQEVG